MAVTNKGATMDGAANLVVITPVRNEAKYLQETITSVVNQKLRPARWVIVDDGSTDSTAELADKAAASHTWISVIRRPDRGFRKSGAGVMDAFYDGYRMVKDMKWDCIAKLDGDLSFGPDVFAGILDALSRDPKLGICGGDIYHKMDGKTVIESREDPAFHVRGATKFYRLDCWTQIDGLLPVTGWDTLDEVKANMLGWKTARTPAARFLHLRPTGGADGSWKNAFKNGRGSYISGFHPLYVISKCVRRIPTRPFFVQSLGLFMGFFSSYFSNVGQIQDKALVRYLRDQQMRRLLRQPSIWR
jgi:biofilm PGA synthesis N-glycosyltransferase PgaC